MSLGLAGLIAVLGAAALFWGVRHKRKKSWMMAVSIAGALILLAAIAYILLALIFLNSV